MAAMSYVVLARKYRPRTFAQMVGQEHVVQALTNALTQGRLHHAYLFTGTRGVGKTTVSRILAKSLNCTGPDGSGGVTAEPCGVCQACTEIDADRYLDYVELDAASSGGKDDIRDLIERAAYKPGIGRYKVFMIDESHQLSKDAFNALLKTLEEPPEYLKFVLATTDPEKMLPTVLSRCLQFNLRPMAPDTVREHLQRVLAAEGVPCDDGALRLLARAARGSMRDGLSLTDQAIAYGGGQLAEAAVRTMLGSVDRSHARSLVAALARRDGAAVLAAVGGLRELGLSAAGTLEEMALLLQQMAVQQVVPGALDARDPDTADALALAGALAADETQLLYSMVLHGREELSLMSDEYGALTMVLLRFLAFPSSAATAPAAPPATEPLREAAPTRGAPLRAAAPPALSLPAAPTPAAVRSVPPPPAAATVAAPADPATAVPSSSDLGERWAGLVQRLCTQGRVAALVRELAMQSGLRRVDDSTAPVRWQLVVERETLRTPQLRDKLAAALAAELGVALALDLEPGVPDDTPARREAAERQRRQAAAEETIRNDPVVRELMTQFKSARIVPGSIKPV
jgi:DNA polymerase III subunit gamma/tau